MPTEPIKTKPKNRIADCAADPQPGLAEVIDRVNKLKWQQEQLKKSKKSLTKKVSELDGHLAIADSVTSALETLSAEMFQRVVGTLEQRLTVALREILGQPIKFRATPKSLRNSAALEFSIERDGNQEDAKRAQGGSVHNILSVGLRLFALASLSEEHRGFLVLDEQDCWLHPELVPKLVQIVSAAAKELGFQVIMISHHDTRLFDQHADKIYRLQSKNSRVELAEYLHKPM